MRDLDSERRLDHTAKRADHLAELGLALHTRKGQHDPAPWQGRRGADAQVVIDVIFVYELISIQFM
jgi:hypothetical protein